MKKITIILTVLIISVTTYSQKKIAIFNPVDANNTGMQIIIREVLSTEINKSNKYTVLERALIDKLLEEHKIDETGLFDEKTTSALGKFIGADYVCIALIEKLGDNFFITSKIVDVTTAVSLKQEYVTTQNGKSDLFKRIEELAFKLVDKPIPERIRTCDVCGGIGYRYEQKDCSNCKNGKITVIKRSSYTHDICPKCDGLGKFDLCVICNGSGKTTDYKGSVVSCRTCGGDGTKGGFKHSDGTISGSICDRCGGDGRINEKETTKGGTYYEDCSKCEGKGTRKIKIKCERCKGSGTVTE